MITSVQRTAINCPPRTLDQPDHEAADHRAADAADAAQHRRGERPQAGSVADDEAGEIVVEAKDQCRRTRQRRAEEKRGHDHPVDLDAHHSRRLGVLSGRPHRFAEPGSVHKQMKADHQCPGHAPDQHLAQLEGHLAQLPVLGAGVDRQQDYNK